MNDPMEDTLAHAFDAYARELDQLQPSVQLDARMQAAISSELSRAPRMLQRRWPAWGLAASMALLAGITSLALARYAQIRGIAPTVAQPAEQAAPQQPAAYAAAARDATMVLPAGAVSLWPTEATVFRVRSRLGTASAEQQYWIDVRIANDGSMRIERVFAADGSELFSRPAAHGGPFN